MPEYKQHKLNKLVFLVNERKADAVAAADEACAFLRRHGVKFFLPVGASEDSVGYPGHDIDALVRDLRACPVHDQPELAVVFGGDGTLISAARLLAGFGIPLIGVNLGRLGFLMSLELDEMPGRLLDIVHGDYIIEPRTQIVGELVREGRTLAVEVAQNDIVINNGNISRMIGMELWVDGIQALAMKGDGLIVATPTGSTAYSLSAGGSIAMPETDVMLVTPVAAHSLSSRPLVISAASEIRVAFSNTAATAKVSFDGQIFFDLTSGDEIIIRKNPHAALFMWPEPGMFLKKLRAKLLVQ